LVLKCFGCIGNSQNEIMSFTVDHQHYASASQVIRKICLDELVQPTQCQNEVQVQDLDSWDVQRPHRTRKGSSDKRDAIDLGTSTIMISSPLGLLEELFGDDPWRLLMSTILLNRTRRNQVDAVFSELLDRWPTPHALIEMAYGFENDDKILDELVNLIAPLGIKNRRAKGIIRFCQEYVDLVTRKQEHNGGSNVDANQGGNDAALEATRTNSTNEKCFGVEFQFTREEILNLYHCGDYCADAYQIFVQQNWDNLHPLDHALRAYVEWKQSQTVQ
jgi:endonuclease III